MNSKQSIEEINKAIAELEDSGQSAGEISDKYHSFRELYEFRKAYNAALFNEWYLSGKYNVHKSIRHEDGELCFGGGWFIVVAMLPTGQISNHYKEQDWGLFKIPATEKALYPYDGHTPQDVLNRLLQLEAQEQLSEEEAYALWRELTPQPSDTLYDKSTFEWHRRNGRLQTAKDFHNIAMAFSKDKAQEQVMKTCGVDCGCMNYCKMEDNKAQEQKPELAKSIVETFDEIRDILTQEQKAVGLPKLDEPLITEEDFQEYFEEEKKEKLDANSIGHILIDFNKYLKEHIEEDLTLDQHVNNYLEEYERKSSGMASR